MSSMRFEEPQTDARFSRILMGKAKDAETLSVHASKANIGIIAQRAELLSMTKSKFAALVIENWVSLGCPPVSEGDRLMQIAKQSEKRDAKTTKRAS
jgi:hypothetical protein